MARQMKSSGIEWIGDIPAHWQVIPHKYVMHKEKSICENYNGEDIISLTMNGVIVRDLTAGGKMPTTFDGYQYVEPEDLLLCLFDIDVTPRCVGIVRNYGVTSPAYSRFKVHNGYYNAYYDYLLRFIDDEKVFIHLSKNLRSSLTETDFGAIKTIVPPLDEQKRIAEFLDRQCSEIEAVIAKTKATIEEYKKLRKSIITEAVTKGIRGDRPMKDSGIEWIGEIPSEWDCLKAKYLFQEGDGSLKIGPFGSALNGKTLAEGTYKIYNQAHLVSNDFSLSRHFVSESTFEELKSYEVKAGDVLFSMMGTIGKCRIMPSGYCKGIMDSHLLKARLNELIDVDYFVYVYDKDNSSIGIGQLNYFSNGSIMSGLNSTIVKNIYIPLPPKEEQKEIVEYLKIKCSEIDKLISSKTTLLEEMETYKKSVIYDYTTGKKEVL